MRVRHLFVGLFFLQASAAFATKTVTLTPGKSQTIRRLFKQDVVVQCQSGTPSTRFCRCVQYDFRTELIRVDVGVETLLLKYGYSPSEIATCNEVAKTDPRCL